MKPGATAAPCASTTRDADPLSLPISAILPSFTATSPRNGGIPEPSTIRPLRINRSYVIGFLSSQRTSCVLPSVAHVRGRGYPGSVDRRQSHAHWPVLSDSGSQALDRIE